MIQAFLTEGSTMNAEAVRAMLRRQPFSPFAIVMSSGERHIVKHPECLAMTPNRLVVVDPDTEAFAVLAMLHVVELQGLERQSA
jgi:hypothetical protein